MEKQFYRYVLDAQKAEEETGPALVKRLEVCLDNLTYRMGFASSIRQARQMVTHGHIHVNGKRINIPSYQVQVGDVISLSDRGRKVDMFKENYETNFVNAYPYITKEKNNRATLSSEPAREDIPIEIEDQLIVEFYSGK